jgi:putative permease
MKTPEVNHQLRLDIIKMLCLAGALAGAVAVFIVTPAMSTPTVISILVTMILSPLVTACERRGLSRTTSILSILFLICGAALLLCIWGTGHVEKDWQGFRENAPQYFDLAIQKFRTLESSLKTRYPFLSATHPTDALLAWGTQTGKWFVENGAALMASALSWIFLVPILTFFLLKEGLSIRKSFFNLVPNRFFELAFLMTTEITTALSDYLGAKLLEAFLVGLLTWVGLLMVKAPYAAVLGVLAGITNIIPYAGPILGAVPGLLIAFVDSTHPGLIMPMAIVYISANLIDTVLIFPLVVAKLVKLHPLLLIAVVAMGQQYYGLIGMLISIPVATTLKVIFREIYSAVYEQRSARRENEIWTEDQAA